MPIKLACTTRNFRNTLYVNKEQKKLFCGCKRMKDKTRITITVCTSEPGVKCPLIVIRKSRKPKCFSVPPPPLPYKE